MQIHATPAIQLVGVVMPIVIALLFIAAASALREPSRQKFMAIMMAGAGSAYLNEGWGNGNLLSPPLLRTAPIEGSRLTAGSVWDGSYIPVGM
jgi:hypothetical protein